MGLGIIDNIKNRPKLRDMRNSSKKLIETLPDQAPAYSFAPPERKAEPEKPKITNWEAPSIAHVHEGVHAETNERPVPPPPPPPDPHTPQPETKPEPEPEMPELSMEQLMENVPPEKRPIVQRGMKRWYDNFSKGIQR